MIEHFVIARVLHISFLSPVSPARLLELPAIVCTDLSADGNSLANVMAVETLTVHCTGRARLRAKKRACLRPAKRSCPCDTPYSMLTACKLESVLLAQQAAVSCVVLSSAVIRPGGAFMHVTRLTAHDTHTLSKNRLLVFIASYCTEARGPGRSLPE